MKVSESPRETLLILSRQFHPQWIARSTGKKLETVLVNDFWFGVRVPPSTREVELAFEPWTRWIWVVHALLALGALAAFGASRAARLRAR